MSCKYCGSNKYKKNGKRGHVQRYKCNKCNREYSDSYENNNNSNVNTSS